MNRIYYIDEETGELKEGYPESKINCFGTAPMFISDSMTPYYHPAAEIYVDSKKRLKEIDMVCGTITTDKLQSNPSAVKKRIKERHEDIHKSMHKAVAQLKNGTAPLSEETRELCKKKNQQIKSIMGFDAQNVLK